MRVAELAETLAITTNTVRHYTRLGYLTPKNNRANAYKEYGDKDQRRLQFILSTRQLGLPVTDIKLILEEADKGRIPCPLTQQLMEQRLDETEQLFLQTLTRRNKLKAAIDCWRSKPEKMPGAGKICHLIAEFSGKIFEESSR